MNMVYPDFALICRLALSSFMISVFAGNVINVDIFAFLWYMMIGFDKSLAGCSQFRSSMIMRGMIIVLSLLKEKGKITKRKTYGGFSSRALLWRNFTRNEKLSPFLWE